MCIDLSGMQIGILAADFSGSMSLHAAAVWRMYRQAIRNPRAEWPFDASTIPANFAESALPISAADVGRRFRFL